MTIEILCSGCDDCNVLRGKVCQALADLNLDADVISVYDPFRRHRLTPQERPELLIDGKPVALNDPCTVRELRYLLDKRVGLLD